MRVVRIIGSTFEVIKKLSDRPIRDRAADRDTQRLDFRSQFRIHFFWKTPKLPKIDPWKK
jgi:hypothetical protein